MAKNKDKDNSDAAFLETLVDLLSGERQHPALRAVDKMAENFHFLVLLRWDILLKEYKENSGCKVEGCVACAYSYKQNMRLFNFIREVIEPHKEAYIAMVKDIRGQNDAYDRLQSETKSQNREHN
jgi:hypothetical protein